MIENDNSINLFCKRCQRTWKYKGKGIYYTCCPICHTNVSIRHARRLLEEK